MSQRDCLRESSNRHRFTLFFILTVFSPLIANPTLATQLASGPMPGYVGMRQATIWLQTKIPATVTMQYWPTEKPIQRQHSILWPSTRPQIIRPHLKIQGLNPGTDYQYRLFLNGVEEEFDAPLTFHTQPLWQWREPPPILKWSWGPVPLSQIHPSTDPVRPMEGDSKSLTPLPTGNPPSCFGWGTICISEPPMW